MKFDMNTGGLVMIDQDVSHLAREVFKNGKIVIKPAAFYNDYTQNEIRLFLHHYAIYALPTQELIDWLRDHAIGTTIEIGAGNGAIGRALGIPITDNKMQNWPTIRAHYEKTGQPIIDYPDDVEELDYKVAITKYKPQTVIGAFITHKWKPGMEQGNMFGPEEEIILKRVKRYIMIGNLVSHEAKPILRVKHQELYFPWLITRGVDQTKNRIFVW
jgi:hypothetical protein